MAIMFGIEVTEHFLDEAPEHWGTELMDHVPVVGEVVQLHWLRPEGGPGGREAHLVRVFRVEERHLTIHVRSLEQRVGEFESLRDRIVAAALEAQAGGKKILGYSYGVRHDGARWACTFFGCLCPMGAEIVRRNPAFASHREAAAEALGVDPQWVRFFTLGFDGLLNLVLDDCPEDQRPQLEGAYELGRELRERFLPEPT